MKRMKKKMSLTRTTVSDLSNPAKSRAVGGTGYTDQYTCPIICQGTAGCDCGISDSCAAGPSKDYNCAGSDGCYTQDNYPMCI